MKKNMFGVVMSILLLTSLVVACKPDSQVVEEEQPEIVPSEAVPAEAEPPTETVEAEGEEVGLYGQPIDVPIMDGNRDLQISSNNDNITYKVDGLELQDVLTFYQESLTAAGWEPGPNEDFAGSRNLVTLARKNAVEDRITVTMQNNPIGEFVVLTIVIIRAP